MNSSEFFDEVDIEMWEKFLNLALGKEYSSWTRYIYVSVLALTFVIGVMGNLVTCVVIYCDKTMHTVTNFYLFYLGVSDFIAAFAVLIDIQQLVTGEYQFGWIGCKLHLFVVFLLFNNGVLTMTALSIERYLAVQYPMKLNRKPKSRVSKVIMLVCGLALAETLPEVWTVNVINCPSVTLCYTVPTRFARILNGILGIVSFAVPLTILLFVHTMIAIKVHSSENLKTRVNVFNHRENRKKVNKLVVALTLSYTFCWTPFFMLRATIFLYNVEKLMGIVEMWGLWYNISVVNAWLSVVLNPVLFSLISSKFRKALKNLWERKYRPTRISTTSMTGFSQGNKI